MPRKNEVIELPADFSASYREPELVIDEGRRAAAALMSVVQQKKNTIKMGGEQYLEYEDWQLVARFFGVTVKVTSSSLINIDGVIGYEASADAIRSDGTVISSAEAMCLNDEPKWGARPRYEWRDVVDEQGKKIWVNPSGDRKGHYKTEKVRLAEDEKVPLFQLRSMAQTRACAKALRNVFAWVVVLAGFGATVAEELTVTQLDPVDPEEGQGGKPVVEPPKSKEAAKPAAKPAAAKGKAAQPAAKAQTGKEAEPISEPMARLIRHNLNTSGVNLDSFLAHFKVGEIDSIPIARINEALELSKKGATA